MKISTIGMLGWFAVVSMGTTTWGEESSSYEKGSDGVTYKVTRRVVQRSVPTTSMQTREETIYRPQVTTKYTSYQQNYATPVTEYRWVSRMRGWWNPLTRPYWTHQLEPFTRWENRPATVQIPTTQTDWVQGTRTSHVPVTTYRTVQEEFTSRVAVNVPSTDVVPGTAIANRPSSRSYGSQRLESDPPRKPSGWTERSSYRR